MRYYRVFAFLFVRLTLNDSKSVRLWENGRVIAAKRSSADGKEQLLSYGLLSLSLPSNYKMRVIHRFSRWTNQWYRKYFFKERYKLQNSSMTTKPISLDLRAFRSFFSLCEDELAYKKAKSCYGIHQAKLQQFRRKTNPATTFRKQKSVECRPQFTGINFPIQTF